jgi:ribosomal protein S18 acetylase RimI-like enzyme
MVLEYENKIIGTVMGGYDGHRGVMNYLAVDPNFRGHGFGKMLVEAVEDKLKNRGCPKINLLVRSDNIEVSDFYEGIDYKKQGDVSVFGKRLISDD